MNAALLDALGPLTLGCLGAQGLAWLWCQWRQDATLVDAVWAGSLATAAVGGALLLPGDPLTRLAVGSLAGLWYGRLAVHLLRRSFGEAQEDRRYRALREALQRRMGRGSALGWLAFFVLQAGLAVLFSVPLLWLCVTPAGAYGPMQPLVVGLVALGGLGAFWGQTTADRQLAAHRADPARRGQVLDTGLWRLSRHPNYFFEWLHWLAYPLLGLAAGLWGLWLWPLLMYVFLRYLTGVPFAEQQALRRRGAAYAAYQARTPVFFPRWP